MYHWSSFYKLLITLLENEIAFDTDEQKLMKSKQTEPTAKCYRITGSRNENHTMVASSMFTLN